VWLIHLPLGTCHKWDHPSVPNCKGVHLGECPVNSPTAHINWSLFNFNRSIVLLAEGSDIYPFASLSPVVDFYLFIYFVVVISVRPVPDRLLGN
jgi:hypothetical protein